MTNWLKCAYLCIINFDKQQLNFSIMATSNETANGTNPVLVGRCSSCKFWNTDREEFSKSNIGWGYCTNKAIRTPMHLMEWKNNNELNPNRDSIVSSDFKGFLTEENRQKGVVGIFQTGENFGCVHYNAR